MLLKTFRKVRRLVAFTVSAAIHYREKLVPHIPKYTSTTSLCVLPHKIRHPVELNTL